MPPSNLLMLLSIYWLENRYMPTRPNAKRTHELAEAFLSVKNKVEFKKFIRDLCTIEEIDEMGKRWQTVKLIQKGIPYRTIAQKLCLSTTTVARTARWFNQGKGGYKLVLKRTQDGD